MYNMLDERITNTLTSRTFYKFVGFSVNLQTLSRVLRKSCVFWSVVPKSRVFWSGFMENSFWLLNNLQHCTQLTLLQRGFIPAVVSRNGCNGLGSELMFATFSIRLCGKLNTLQRYNAQCFGQNWILHVWALCFCRVPPLRNVNIAY